MSNSIKFGQYVFYKTLRDIFKCMISQEVIICAKNADATLYTHACPTVFGTKVISTVLVCPVVILVFCKMTLFESF